MCRQCLFMSRAWVLSAASKIYRKSSDVIFLLHSSAVQCTHTVLTQRR